MSYEEIAALQDVPAGTVKSRLHEARRQLRRRLGEPER
jgi:DNA-directed RNA polymerase specialized sigma24 family protein